MGWVYGPGDLLSLRTKDSEHGVCHGESMDAYSCAAASRGDGERLLGGEGGGMAVRIQGWIETYSTRRTRILGMETSGPMPWKWPQRSASEAKALLRGGGLAW